MACLCVCPLLVCLSCLCVCVFSFNLTCSSVLPHVCHLSEFYFHSALPLLLPTSPFLFFSISCSSSSPFSSSCSFFDVPLLLCFFFLPRPLLLLFLPLLFPLLLPPCSLLPHPVLSFLLLPFPLVPPNLPLLPPPLYLQERFSSLS